MRAVVQRVTSARVDVEGEVVATLEPSDRTGLLVLLGVTHEDTPDVARRVAAKIAGLRVLRDERSVTETGGGVLVVSQFTLYGDARKGRRPTWTAAAPGDVAEPLYALVCSSLRELGVPVATGRFGADMQIVSTNDGPVTILLEL